MQPASAVLQLPPPPEMWLGVPVRTYGGKLDEVRQFIPRFERRPFRVAPAAARTAGTNAYCDMIVRAPNGQEPEIPVGIVSRTYRLVQHAEVFDAAVEALRKVGVAAADIEAELRITDNGERMALTLLPPDSEKYRFKVDERDAVRMQFACFNSVEASTRFEAVLGWLRLVCTNGLILGTTITHLRRWHVGDLCVEGIAAVVKAGMEVAATERAAFEEWRRHAVGENTLRHWVDETLTDRWGVRAAARAWHICREGLDAIIPQFARGPASTVDMAPGRYVPGAFTPARDAFAVAQALSWLAGQRRELPEQVQWMKETPELVAELIALS